MSQGRFLHPTGYEKLMVAVLGLLAASSMMGCVAVGYSSRGGMFVWPGGLGLLLLVLLIVFVLRRS